MDEPCVRSYNTVCRLCLCAGDECLISVFDENHPFLPQRIASCVNVEVHATDKMSTMICKLCLTKVEEWFAFKNCCEDSQSKLRQWLQAGASPVAAVEKCVPMAVTIKEEIDSDEQLQLVETSVYIKNEPLYLSESEAPFETQTLNSAPASPTNYSLSVVNSFDSLLVPARECPVTVHGIHAPYFCGDNGEFANDNQCRICGKEFSNNNNRNRHERTVHSLEREANKQYSQNGDRPPPPPALLLPPPPPPASDACCSDDPSNVTIEQFAASLQLIQTNPPQPAKPVSERQFLEYNRKMCNMLETGTCEFCNWSFSSSKNLMRHLAKKIKIERFSCFFCCISFPNRSQYMKHNLKKYCKQRARMVNSGNCAFKSYQHYECRLCKVLYVHKLLLTRHLVSRHLADSYPVQCARCTTTVPNADVHKEHLQGPCCYRIYCSICKTTYDTLAEFETHTSLHDDNDASGIDIYLKPGAYNSESDGDDELSSLRPRSVGRPKLKRHKYKHMAAGCPVCPKRYSSYENMLRHFKLSHKKHKLYKCLLCTRKFATESDLHQHMDYVHRQPDNSSSSAGAGGGGAAANKYSCGQCGALFATLDLWCDHQKSHATHNVFQCGECSRVFGSQEELDLHRTEHPNNIKLKLYRCSNSNSYTAIADFSPAATTTTGAASAAVVHPLTCTVCFESFATSKQLQKHSILHSSTQLASVQAGAQKSKKKKQKNKKKKKNNRGVYECLLCDKTYALSSSLWKHRKVNHGVVTSRKKRLCTVCNKVFGSVKAMWYHRKKYHSTGHQHQQRTEHEAPLEREQRALRNIKRELYHNESEDESEVALLGAAAAVDMKPFQHICEICNKSFPTLKGLSIHAKLHAHREHLARGERAKCQVCQQDFHNVESLLDHMKSHSTKVLNNILNIESDKPALFECPVCDKVLLNNAGLASHLKTHAGEPGTHGMGINERRSFKCTVCKMALMTAVSLANHMRVHVRPAAGYACTVCKVTCTSAAALKAHYQNVHHFKGRVAAKIAMDNNNTSSSSSSSTSSSNNNSAGERFACSHCPKTFLRQHLLDSHTRTCAKQYKCLKCHRMLATATAYTRHAKQFHNRLVCLECNKFFDTGAALCSHKGWHNRTTPSPPPDAAAAEELKCVACDEQFHNKAEYVKHVHTHKEPFKCKFCARVFSYLKPLKKHIAYIHSNELARSRAVLKKAAAAAAAAAAGTTGKAGKKLRDSALRTAVNVKVEPNTDHQRPYKCTECHTGFMNAKKLRLHVQAAHTMAASL